MTLYPINAGNFMLDGGAMFGVVPKSIWNKLNPSDNNNMCNWAMRCLLIEDKGRLILVDNGMGNKQDAKFFSHYFLNGNDSLESSLASKGFSKDDITDVFLTHLHFDHCGGSVEGSEGNYKPAFKNATYWSNKDHWQWATNPNAREKASFLKENILPLENSGQLKFVETAPGTVFSENISIQFVNGHTDAMMIPHISYKGHKLIYMADLLPSIAHVPLPYVMAYDTRPLLTMEEKKKFLQDAVDNKYILFFEHDKDHECCTLKMTDKGVRPDEIFKLEAI